MKYYKNSHIVNFLLLCFITCSLAENVNTLSESSIAESPTNAARTEATSSTTDTTDAIIAASTSTAATLDDARLFVTPSSDQRKTYIISSDIPTCQKNDNDLNGCIKRAFEIMLPRFKDGFNEFQIPPLDPFRLNRTIFEYASGPIKGRIIMKDALVMGFNNLRIGDVDFKILEKDRVSFHMTAFVPSLIVTGNYKADVAINTIRVRPRGTFNVTINKINFNQSTDGSFYEKDNHRFVRLNNFDLQPMIEGLRVNVTGIFPDPTMNDIVLNAANRYWREIYRFALPEVNRYLAPLLLRIANESFKTLPIDLVLKEN